MLKARNEISSLLGFVILMCLILKDVVPFRGEAHDNFFFLLVAFLALCYVALSRTSFVLGSWLGRLFSLAALVVLFSTPPVSTALVALTGAVLQIVTKRLIEGKSPAPRKSSAESLRENLDGLLANTVFWSVACKLVWWEDLDVWIESWSAALSYFATFALALWFLTKTFTWGAGERHCNDPRSLPRMSFSRAALSCVAIVLAFAPFCFRLPFERSHWSFYIGPIELVRQGGVLLWDTPSQYGFLHILIAAMLPFKNAWTSFYALNSTLNLLFALLPTLFFARLFPRWSYVVTFAILFGMLVFFRGSSADFAGGNAFPSGGAMRFFLPVVLLLFVGLFADARRASTLTSGARRRWVWTGHALWLVGCLWSFECAVYCSSTWLAAFAVWTWIDERTRHAGRIALAMLQPIWLILGTVVIVVITYQVRYGHRPDYFAFIEFPLAYANGYFAVPIYWSGGVSAFLLLVCFLACVGARLARAGLWDRMPVVVASFGLLGSTATYFVSRSMEQNITCLLPIVILVGLVPAITLAREPGSPDGGNAKATHVLHAADFWKLAGDVIVPLAVVMMTATFGHEDFLGLLFQRAVVTRSDPLELNALEQELPVLDPAATALLNRTLERIDSTTGVRDHVPRSPIAALFLSSPNGYCVEVDPTALTPLQNATKVGTRLAMLPDDSSRDKKSFVYWLPMAPIDHLRTLSEDRQRVYVKRFLERRAESRAIMLIPDGVKAAFHLALLHEAGYDLVFSLDHLKYSAKYFERSTAPMTK